METQQNHQEKLLFYRLGPTREQDLFRDFKDYYDGVIVNANYLTYFRKFTVNLLAELQKPFFIDPVTYIFARDPNQIRNNRGELKKSYAKLKDLYGSPISEKAGNSILNINDFSQIDLGEFVDRVITVQSEHSLDLPPKYKRYQKYVEEAGIVQPSFILPPYFFVERFDDGWLQLNLNLAIIAYEQSALPIYPVIFVSKDLITNIDNVRELVRQYNRDEFAGYVVWVDDLSGVYSDEKYLRGFRDLVVELSSLNKPIINLYGDYYSVLLTFDGLTGLGAGICYGEKKSVDPGKIAGAIPDRYYIYSTKNKFRLETTIARIEKQGDPDLLNCECEVCIEVTSIINLSTEETQQHFILVRRREIGELNQMSRREILDELGRTLLNYKDDPIFKITHIRRWGNIF